MYSNYDTRLISIESPLRNIFYVYLHDKSKHILKNSSYEFVEVGENPSYSKRGKYGFMSSKKDIWSKNVALRKSYLKTRNVIRVKYSPITAMYWHYFV